MSQELKILIIDDDEIDRMSVIRELRRLGSHVVITEAETGAEGLNELRKADFNCILLDYGLPDCVGLDFLNKIDKSLPVIVLTGREDEELGTKLIQHGAQDYLVKGKVDGSLLMRTIRYAIERKKSADALLESSERFRSLFEVTSDCIFILDSENKILQTNPATNKELGYTEEELKGKNITSLLTPESKELFILQISIPSSMGTHRHELEVTRKRGKNITVDCSISEVLNSNGKLLNKAVSLRDITNQKLAEEKLRKGKDIAESANREIQSELEIAREIQEGLYPKDLPKMAGLEIAADLFQARKVGGDYYDIIPINDHEMAFVLVDVAGHDIAAAFIVGMAKLSFLAHIPVYSSIVEIFNHVNEDMIKVIKEERFLSVFMAIINTYTKTLKYAKAGHPDQYLFKANTHQLQCLETDGMFIGAFNEGRFEEKTCSIENGDKLILFTDGITENRNKKNEQYGDKRLFDLIEREGHNDAQFLHETIIREHRKFCNGVKPNDDICLLIVEFQETVYHHQIKTLFNGELPSLPGIILDSKRTTNEAITNVLCAMDDNGYNDSLIRHYKKILQLLIIKFHESHSFKISKLRIVAHINDLKIKIVLFIDIMKQGQSFFTTQDCHEILACFNKSYGEIEINETGDRLIFKYIKEKIDLDVVSDFTIETRSDGSYIVIPQNIDPLTTVDSIKKNLLGKNIINVDYDLLEKAFKNRSGVPERIGERFIKYIKEKNDLFKLQLNSLEAKIILKKNNKIELTLSKEDILFILQKNNVIYGIRHNVIDELVKYPEFEKEFLIAAGTPAVNGRNSRIEECVKIDPDFSPVIKSNGSVDFKSLNLMETVKPGTVILKKIPAMPGVAGISIYGRTIDQIPGNDIAFTTGENTEISNDGTKLLAKVGGYLLREGNIIHVKQIFYIPANVDYSTGNITYDGDVYIAGNVLSGFNIKTSGNITINGEIEGSEIVSENGSIYCNNGVLGKGKAKIIAGNQIEAEFIQEASIFCNGDLVVNRSILNVMACTKGNVSIGKEGNGKIIGGELSCSGSITVSEIGSRQYLNTIINMKVNENPELQKEIRKARNAQEELKRTFSSVENQLQTKSRLFKIKAKKTAAEKMETEKLLKKYYNVKNQQEKINKLIHTLKEREEKECSYGDIIVTKEIYPNVILRFGKLERKISSTIGPVIFRKVDSEIVIRPYQENV